MKEALQTYEQPPANFGSPILKNTSVLERAIDGGIPLTKCQFHAAVNNANQVPTHYFSVDSSVKDRNCEMWLTNVGYVFKQKNIKGEDCYFGTPTANVIFHNFK